MSKKIHQIRFNILLLLTMIFMVMTCLTIYLAVERRSSDLAKTLERLQLHAKLISEEQGAAVRHVHQLIEWFSDSSTIRDLKNDPECAKTMTRLLKQDEHLTNMFIIEPNGNAICNPYAKPGKTNLSGRAYFQQAIQSKKVVIGAPLLGQFSNLWVIPFAKSVHDKDGTVLGVLVLSLDLAWINKQFAKGNYTQETRLGLVDKQGNILARFPDPEHYVGQNMISEPAVKTIIAQNGTGTAEIKLDEKTTRIFAFSHFLETTGGPVYLWIGQDKKSVVAPANQEFAAMVGLTLGFLFLTLYITWYWSERVIVRPLLAITGAARRLSMGEYQARSGVVHNGSEIGQLAEVFDNMASALITKNQILRLNRALKVLSHCNTVLIHAQNESQLLHDICKTIVETGNYRMAWVGLAMQDAEKRVNPVAVYGAEDGYLANANISWGDNAYGRGPTGTAIRTQTPQINQNFETNPALLPWRENALKHGYRSSSAFPLIAASTVIGALTIYSSEIDTFSPEEVDLLEELAADLSYGILMQRLRNSNEENLLRQEKSLESTVHAMATTLEMRDPYTAGHQRRVSQLAEAIALALSLDANEVHGIKLAAVVHDIGKIQVPAEILTKPTRLTALEYEILKLHPRAGYEILKGIDFPWPIAQMVLQHHERNDGSGYPDGLSGDQIVLGARILAVADVVESMASLRPYRAALGIEAALEEIEVNRGRLYDPDVVDVCIRLFKDKHFLLD